MSVIEVVIRSDDVIPDQPDYGGKCVLHAAFGPCECAPSDRNSLYRCASCGLLHWHTFSPLGSTRICTLRPQRENQIAGERTTTRSFTMIENHTDSDIAHDGQPQRQEPSASLRSECFRAFLEDENSEDWCAGCREIWRLAVGTLDVQLDLTIGEIRRMNPCTRQPSGVGG